MEKERKKYVLVLDENFAFRYFLSKGLRDQGYECIEAWDYKLATLYLKKNTFDIVLADFKTFINCGMGSCSNESRLQNRTPIIFLMEQATDESRETAKRLGAKAIFEKRGDLNDLLEKINLILSSEMPRTKT